MNQKVALAFVIFFISITFFSGYITGRNGKITPIHHVDSMVLDCPGYDDLISTCYSEISEGIRLRFEVDSLRYELKFR